MKKPSSALEFVRVVKELAANSGGDPAAPPPDAAHLKDLEGYSGNEQLKEIFDKKDRLEKEIEDWKNSQDAVAKLLPGWQTLTIYFLLHLAWKAMPIGLPAIKPFFPIVPYWKNPIPVPSLTKEIADASAQP